MPRDAHLFLIALQFLTRVPVPRWVQWTPVNLNDSARHFPIVGAGIGLFGAIVLWAGAHFWPAPVAVVLSMVATIWLTGAFHEDGLADTCDGLGGHVSAQRALQIMKDSRIGTYGAVGLISVLAIKATALHGLATRDLGLALIALPWAHAVSRLVPVTLLGLLAYAGDVTQSKAKPMAQQVTPATLLIAAAWCIFMSLIAAAVGWSFTHLATGIVAAVAVTAILTRWLRMRLGGYTGDTLGAAQQGAEVVLYLALLGSLTRG